MVSTLPGDAGVEPLGRLPEFQRGERQPVGRERDGALGGAQVEQRAAHLLLGLARQVALVKFLRLEPELLLRGAALAAEAVEHGELDAEHQAVAAEHPIHFLPGVGPLPLEAERSGSTRS